MEIYLYGCGSHAKVILDILHHQGRDVKAFVDDNPPSEIAQICRVPVYLASDALSAIKPERSQWIVAIANNGIRQHIVDKLKSQGHSFTTAIHPSVQIAFGVQIGLGSVVMANVAINTNSYIGNHVIINTGSSIDHDCTIGDYCHIAPGCSLCGEVSLGAGAFLGVGTCVTPGIEIGTKTICGAGSVVISSLPSHSLAYGCPAKVIQTLDS